jgi:hypothetical protein
LISVQNDTEIIWRKLKNLKYVPYQSPTEHPPRKFLGIFGRSNVLGKYQTKLENLEENVRIEQSDTIRRQVHIHTYMLLWSWSS